jgi:hypothetical protein
MFNQGLLHQCRQPFFHKKIQGWKDHLWTWFIHQPMQRNWFNSLQGKSPLIINNITSFKTKFYVSWSFLKGFIEEKNLNGTWVHMWPFNAQLWSNHTSTNMVGSGCLFCILLIDGLWSTSRYFFMAIIHLICGKQ